MRDVILRIENMHCGACVKRVSEALERLAGVEVGEVRVGAARVLVPENLPEGVLVSAMEKAGYPAVVEN